MVKISKQVELALAYNCEDKIGTERLVQYIHHNREANALRIDAMGNPLNDTNILFPFPLSILKLALNRQNG